MQVGVLLVQICWYWPKKTFFLGLLCCQCLEELNLAYNNIALIAEVKKLASLTNLSNLSVEGELKQEVLEAIVDESFFFIFLFFVFDYFLF